jgi:hypothetical protein
VPRCTSPRPPGRAGAPRARACGWRRHDGPPRPGARRRHRAPPPCRARGDPGAVPGLGEAPPAGLAPRRDAPGDATAGARRPPESVESPPPAGQVTRRPAPPLSHRARHARFRSRVRPTPAEPAGSGGPVPRLRQAPTARPRAQPPATPRSRAAWTAAPRAAAAPHRFQPAHRKARPAAGREREARPQTAAQAPARKRPAPGRPRAEERATARSPVAAAGTGEGRRSPAPRRSRGSRGGRGARAPRARPRVRPSRRRRLLRPWRPA